MSEIIALAMKDLRVLVRDKVGAFFVFVFPIGYASLFGSIMAGMSGGEVTSGMEVAVVDRDQTEASAAFVQQLRDAPEIEVYGEEVDRETAADLVRKGRQAAYVVIPAGFGAARQNMFWGEPPAMEVGVDPSRSAESGMLEGILTKTLFAGMQERMSDPSAMSADIRRNIEDVQSAKDIDPATRIALLTFLPALENLMSNLPAGEVAERGFAPVRIQKQDIAPDEKEEINAYSISFPQGLVWAVMGCSAGFGIALVMERTRGTLIRLQTSPMGRWKILAGKGLACLITTLGVAAMLFGAARIVFGLTPQSYPMLIMAVLCVSLSFVGIMMLLSVMGKTEQSAGGIGWAVLIVLAMIGGGMMPYMFLPEWMKTVASISPIKWSILAMEGALFRDFSLVEMLKPCGILLGIGALCYAIGARAFRWTQG